uniref:Uncharacterized protein n=1 Tax=Micrurus corallinus TaxID=54390 RepID=A0A2D4F152_MICCO
MYFNQIRNFGCIFDSAKLTLTLLYQEDSQLKCSFTTELFNDLSKISHKISLNVNTANPSFNIEEQSSQTANRGEDLRLTHKPCIIKMFKHGYFCSKLHKY